MFRKVTFFQVVCNDCQCPASEPRATPDQALDEAVEQGYEHYGSGDGTGKNAVWRCPECCAAYEASLPDTDPVEQYDLNIPDVVRLEGTIDKIAVMSDGTRRPWADVYMDENIRAGRHPANPHIRLTPAAPVPASGARIAAACPDCGSTHHYAHRGRFFCSGCHASISEEINENSCPGR